MTIGAFALMALETAPVTAPARDLAAIATTDAPCEQIIRRTDVPLQPIKWRNVIVHGSAAGRPGIAERCHFIVGGDGQIALTGLWRRQQSGHHVYVPGRDFNADSIGICLTGDFRHRPPPAVQLTALVDLTRTLQQMFRIPGDRVYLHSELDRNSRSPGAAFPAGLFNRSLHH